MAPLNKLIAHSLEKLHELQQEDPNLVLKGTEKISRTHLRRLLEHGWIQEIIKGWYVPSRPGSEGDTTVWYTSYWNFIRTYLDNRFGGDWCLSPESSLDLLSGKTTVPAQLIVKSPKGSNLPVLLPFKHSLLPLKSNLPNLPVIDPITRMRCYSLEEGLVYASPTFFTNDEVTARTCLNLMKDVDEVLRIVVETGATVRAGRLAGALRNIGRLDDSDKLLKGMADFGYRVIETDPFTSQNSKPFRLEVSPYVARIKHLWLEMRSQVIANFPELPSGSIDSDSYLSHIEEKYAEDAYHSLSIEGYHVSRELIEKVRLGNWAPNEEDKDHKRALVARGYYQAFQAVKESISSILKGQNPGKTAEADHSSWYRQLWMPFVTAGILRPTDLIGYRKSQVYIRGSKHIPLNPDAIPDAMGVLFELLSEEDDPRVRAVLGHFFFGFIHPYMDGNGRMGRFLLNVMLASGGYPWTIVPHERRSDYMHALEKASVHGDITDFARLIGSLVYNN